MADPIVGLDAIPSNFDINDFLDTNLSPCQTAQGEGKLRFLCDPAHLSYNDPIVYPGQEGAAHLHHFFGNASTDHNSTYESLRTTGDGTCAGGPINRTAYWFPAMIKPAGPGFPTPKVVKPSGIEMYYHNQPIDLDDYTSPNPAYDHYTTEGEGPFPNGLQMVWGWKHDHPIPDPSVVWGRDAAASAGLSTRQGTLDDLYHYTKGLDSQGVHPVSGYYDNIFARIVSPRCWDGANLVLPGGRDHLAAPFQDQHGHLICPDTHKFRIPALTVIIWWANNGPEDWRHWYLSVDRHQGHNLDGGHGFHTDWFGAWDSDIQDIWEEELLSHGQTTATHGQTTSINGRLCRDDLIMDQTFITAGKIPNGWGTYHLPEASRYLDIPNVPGQKRLRLNLTAA